MVAHSGDGPVRRAGCWRVAGAEAARSGGGWRDGAFLGGLALVVLGRSGLRVEDSSCE